MDISTKFGAFPHNRKFITLGRIATDLDWEHSIQYSAAARQRVVNFMRASAPGELESDLPRAAWMGLSGNPCEAYKDGMRPVWVWYTKQEER